MLRAVLIFTRRLPGRARWALPAALLALTAALLPALTACAPGAAPADSTATHAAAALAATRTTAASALSPTTNALALQGLSTQAAETAAVQATLDATQNAVPTRRAARRTATAQAQQQADATQAAGYALKSTQTAEALLPVRQREAAFAGVLQDAGYTGSPVLFYGPESGTLQAKQQIRATTPNLNANAPGYADFVVELATQNELSAEQRLSSRVSISFRVSLARNIGYALDLYGGSWELIAYDTRTGQLAEGAPPVQRGKLPPQDPTPGAWNSYRLIVLQERGWLFFADQPVAELDLAYHLGRGQLYLSHKLADSAALAYHNFTVWQLP
ncbi:MAG: hypothetical protein ACKOC5_11880 [Chloroflexota bacterium]